MKTTEISSRRLVDQNELRINAALIITVLVTAFVSNRWELVAFQAAALFLTTLHSSLGPYIALYRHILRPAGIVKPDFRVDDNPEPHRFAVMFGTIVSSAATYFLITGRSVVGWGLVWLLISLVTAGLAGWCVGCFVYYVLNRLGLRGLFKYSPIKGTFPGVRPPKAE